MVMLKKILYFSSSERLVMGIIVGIISPLIPLIASDLKIGLDYIGIAISLSTIGMFFIALLLGNLIDILGYKIVIFLGLVTTSFGGIGLFFSHSYPFFIISFFILSSGLGILDISTLSLVGYFSSENKLKNIIKIGIIASIGSVIAPLLVSLILRIKLSWQFLYLYLVIAQIVIAVILLFFKIPEKNKTKKNLKVVLQNNLIVFKKPLFLVYCFSMLIYNAILSTFSTWFTTYFTGLNINLNLSSIFLSLYMLSLLLGMVLKNHLINFIKERMLLVISLLISLVLFIFIFFINIIWIKIIFIFLFGLNISGIFSITYSLILGMGGEYINTASSLIFSFSYLGIIIFQFLSGYFSEYYSKNSILYIDTILLFLLFIFSLIIYTKSKPKTV
jgi:FHS family glucose/mannose:H+ symporter-like MFS transporter